MQYERNFYRAAYFFKPFYIKHRLFLINSVRRPYRNCQSVYARSLQIRFRLFGSGIHIGKQIIFFRRFAHMPYFALYRRAECVRYLYHFARFGNILFVRFSRTVEHYRRKPEFQRLYTPVESKTVVVMHHYGNFRSLRRRDYARRDQFQFAVRQQHFRSTEYYGRIAFFRRLYYRLQHIRVGGIEQPHRIFSLLRLSQNFV